MSKVCNCGQVQQSSSEDSQTVQDIPTAVTALLSGNSISSGSLISSPTAELLHDANPNSTPDDSLIAASSSNETPDDTSNDPDYVPTPGDNAWTEVGPRKRKPRNPDHQKSPKSDSPDFPKGGKSS